MEQLRNSAVKFSDETKSTSTNATMVTNSSLRVTDRIIRSLNVLQQFNESCKTDPNLKSLPSPPLVCDNLAQQTCAINIAWLISNQYMLNVTKNTKRKTNYIIIYYIKLLLCKVLSRQETGPSPDVTIISTPTKIPTSINANPDNNNDNNNNNNNNNNNKIK